MPNSCSSLNASAQSKHISLPPSTMHCPCSFTPQSSQFLVMVILYLSFLPLVNLAVAPHGALRAKDNLWCLGENDKVLLRAAILAPAVVLVHAHIIRWNLYGNQEPARLFFLIFPCFSLLLYSFPCDIICSRRNRRLLCHRLGELSSFIFSLVQRPRFGSLNLSRADHLKTVDTERETQDGSLNLCGNLVTAHHRIVKDNRRVSDVEHTLTVGTLVAVELRRDIIDSGHCFFSFVLRVNCEGHYTAGFYCGSSTL